MRAKGEIRLPTSRQRETHFELAGGFFDSESGGAEPVQARLGVVFLASSETVFPWPLAEPAGGWGLRFEE